MVTPLATTTAIITLNPEWSYLEPKFPKIAELLFGKEHPLYIIMLIPMAVIRATSPPEVLDLPAIAAIGDMMAPSNPSSASGIASIISKQDILLGPQEIEVGMFGASITRPVFIQNVSAEEYFSDHPFGLPAPPTNCPKECYDAENKTAYWGHVAITMDMQSLKDGSNPVLVRLREGGYRYSLTQPAGAQKLVYDEEAGKSVSSSGGENMLIKSDSPPGPDAVSVTFSVTPTFGFWVLYIDKEQGWGKPWKWPLVAMVIVLSLVFGVLIFLLLLSRRNNQMLLQALLPKEMIRKLQEDGTMVGGQAAALRSDTPADVMFNVIGECLRGQPPNMHDMMMVRSAILYGADMYQPVGLRERMADQEGDLVASALLQQLGQQMRAETHYPLRTEYSTAEVGVTMALDPLEMGATGKEPDSGILAAIVLRRAYTCGARDSSTIITSSNIGKRAADQGDQSYQKRDFEPGRDDPDTGLSLVLSTGHILPTFGTTAQSEEISTHPCRQHTFAIATAAATLGLGSRPTGELSDTRTPQHLSTSQNSACDEHCDVVVATLKARHQALSALHKHRSRRLSVPDTPLMDEVELFLATHTGLWQFDAFELDRVTQGHPLSTLAFYLMSETGLISQLNLNSKKLARYLCFIEDGYLDNPYHNKVHAADVLQTLHMIVTSGGLIQGEDHLNHLGCYLAAVVHDFEHVGLSNDYLRGTHDPLAMRYNDQAPMENHHLASALSALDLPQHSFLSRVCSSDRLHLRKTLIDMVLATDMKQHFSIVSQFRTCRFALTAEVAGDASQLVRGEHDAEEVLCLSMQMALKCADLGHTCEGLTVHRRWVEALTEEFFLQGDAERAAGMVVQPLFDREKKLGLPPSQVGFFDFVVLPMYSCWVQHFPSAHPMLDAANENLRFWKAGGKS